MRMPQQFFGRSRHWPEVARLLDEVSPLLVAGDRLVDVTEASVRALLRALGWRGQIVRSSRFIVRPERSQRLADLVAAVDADVYLCGTGGRKYLNSEPLTQLGIAVRYVPLLSAPVPHWNRLSALGPVAVNGLDRCRSAGRFA
jgi:hypothetical protein